MKRPCLEIGRWVFTDGRTRHHLLSQWYSETMDYHVLMLTLCNRDFPKFLLLLSCTASFPLPAVGRAGGPGFLFSVLGLIC
ncbi:hypothetical protein RchiOBHm_Chr2g0139091 [Rosa chinensis]|uniref:Uncharacterized protein n=1 Tax=Rosa chinensis TaxID=74649 RepID=A0A2P6RX10_ROSCH|nr:hypothetical protein RchiOBHm_Chr2g0139091 [Rosa chinensis]